MRKIVILLVCVILTCLAYQTVASGFNLGTVFSIPGYEKVAQSSKEIDSLIEELTDINDVKFAQSKNSLTTALKKYKDTKEEYESLADTIEANAEDDGPTMSLVDTYDIDFLWTTIGNYGTEEGISLKFNVVKSVGSFFSTSSYTMCDLKFTVSGNYIPITDFIYDLEDDNKLGFEISDFSIKKGGDNLQATFTVKNVPINNRNLLEITTMVSPDMSVDAYGNPISSGNTSTNTNTTTTSANTNTVNTNTTSNTNTIN